jgi:hypothetical protein
MPGKNWDIIFHSYVRYKQHILNKWTVHRLLFGLHPHRSRGFISPGQERKETPNGSAER